MLVDDRLVIGLTPMVDQRIEHTLQALEAIIEAAARDARLFGETIDFHPGDAFWIKVALAMLIHSSLERPRSAVLVGTIVYPCDRLMTPAHWRLWDRGASAREAADAPGWGGVTSGRHRIVAHVAVRWAGAWRSEHERGDAGAFMRPQVLRVPRVDMSTLSVTSVSLGDALPLALAAGKAGQGRK